MKLLFENWRRYLVEEKPKLNPQQIKQLQDFMKSIAILAQAAEDSDGEAVQEAGGAVRPARARRRKKKRNRQRTTQIKKIAGLTGVKLANFSPEQHKLYNDAKIKYNQQREAQTAQELTNIRMGNLLDNAKVKSIIAKGGRPLELAIMAATAAGGCPGEISLNCIANALLMQAQGA